jgi:iron complex outermembrane receptor protein
MLRTFKRRLATGVFLILFWIVAAGALAAQHQAFNINLPAQSLATSLAGLSKQTGVQIFAAGELVKGKSAPAVTGQMTVQQALDRLLEGSGLEKASSDQGFIIRPPQKASSEPVSPAQQVPAAQPQIMLDPVTVLGSRGADVPLSNVPASITVVEQPEIEKELSTAPRIEDVLSRTVPGFNPTNNGVRQIRGRTAQVFINGVPTNEQMRASSGSDINLLMPEQLGRIEVGRGANSAYGFGSPGGIIALSTPRADSPEFSLKTSVANSFNPSHPGGSYRPRFYQSASQIVGNFDYHLGGLLGYDGLEFDARGRRALGFNSPSAIGSNSKEFLAGIDGSFGYDFGRLGKLRFTGSFSYTNFLEGFEITEGVYRRSQGSVDRFRPADDNFRRSYGLNLSYEKPDLWGTAVKIEVLRSDTDTEAFRRFDDTRNLRDEQKNEYFGVRTSFSTPLDRLVSGLSTNYGFDFLRNRYFRPVFFTDTGALQTFVSPDVTLNSYAPYFQLNQQWGPFRLTGGVRHEEYRGQVDTAVGSGGIQGGDIKSFNLTLFNAGLVYSFNKTIDLFASFSQGAEISQLGRAARGAGTVDNLDPQPAKSNQYEIGARFKSPTIDYNFAAFFTESDLLSALQRNPSDPTGPLIPLREPRKFWGIENSLRWRINEHWGAGGVTTWSTGIRKPEGGDWRRIGARDVPPFLLSSYIDYSPLSWWRNRFRLDYRASTNRFKNSTAFGDGRVDSLVLLHLDAGFDIGPGQLSVGIRNLLNEKYLSIPAQSDNSGFLWVPEEGTRITLSYSFKW